MGIDEAGRGPLAGGVYAAAVSVPLADAARLLDGAWRRVNDSKKLSPRARDELAEIIRSTPGCRWAVASASPAEIDELNILYATHLAMRRAADQVAAALGTDLESVKTESIQGRDLKSVNSRTCLKIGILVDGLPVSTLPFAKNIINRCLSPPRPYWLRRPEMRIVCAWSGFIPAMASQNIRDIRQKNILKRLRGWVRAPSTAAVSDRWRRF